MRDIHTVIAAGELALCVCGEFADSRATPAS